MFAWLGPLPAKTRAESCVVVFCEKQLFGVNGRIELAGGATVAGGIVQQPLAS